MKKGFTLIEMIGVMVILSLLLLFAVPNVINYIKKGGDTKDKVVKTMIYEASKQYITDNQKMFKKDKKNTYCISVNTLATEGYVESPIKLSSSDEDITSDTSTKTVKVTYDKDYKYELVNECNGIVNPTPILYKGLTPVMYDEENGNWVVADPQKDDWYNYDEQRWANAVVLGEGKTKNPGDIVTVEGENPDALMMLVWIPRYEYRIQGEYGKDGESISQPGEIEVNFILKNTITPTDGYHINNAFTFDGEKSGFWVGKFELSHETLSSSTTDNNLGCINSISGVTCIVDSSKFRILPNVSSLRYNDVSNFWYGIKTIENTSEFGLSNIDIHMMKNSEWGAVAYLSQSKYGKYNNSNYSGVNREIYQNKSTEYITGKSNGTPSINALYTQCTYDQKAGTNENQDQNNCGPGASTTGNIYGVYDMSGGAWEYLMGVVAADADNIYSGVSVSKNSGFNGKTMNDNQTITDGFSVPSNKYYDKYALNVSMLECRDEFNVNMTCYGHALAETRNWYNDFQSMILADGSLGPWIVRGGGASTNSDVPGIFYFSSLNGRKSYDTTTRLVGILK